MTFDAIDQLAVNTVRTLSIDAIQAANSGHPGLPMGAAPMAYVLWNHVMNVNPKTSRSWSNRDRFVLSAGHGSALLYSLLHLSGYDVTIDDLKNFRQWGSKTPGHPEVNHTDGVEATTGPLGQGIANAVGMAMAEAHLAAKFNKPGFDIVDHYTYALHGDGCLMEGVSQEAASLAGHLKLGKLVLLYDSNDISLDGPTSKAFTEDVKGKFEAYGWQHILVKDGNDLEAIAKAIEEAKAETEKPSLVSVLKNKVHQLFTVPLLVLMELLMLKNLTVGNIQNSQYQKKLLNALKLVLNSVVKLLKTHGKLNSVNTKLLTQN